MQLSLEELFSSEINPSINKISLDLLRQYYDEIMKPNTYKFLICNNDEIDEIVLKFPKDSFCHLLGVESIVKGSVPYRLLSDYRGENGWDNIKNQTLTFSSLKKINKKNFNNNKSKMVFFYLVPRLLENAKVIRFNQELVGGNTKIECDLLFFDTLQNAYVHLGIKSTDVGYYVPRTFLIEKVTEKNKGTKFIDQQSELEVKERYKIVKK